MTRGLKQSLNGTLPALALLPPSHSSMVMTWTMRCGNGEQLEVVAVSNYPPYMTSLTKLTVAITRTVITLLGKIQMNKGMTQDYKGRTKFGLRLLFKKSHKIRKILIIFNTSKQRSKGAINFRTEATRHRYAPSTAVDPALGPRLKVSIAKHVVLITDREGTIACTHVCGTRRTKIRSILQHVLRHRKWQGITKFATMRKSRFWVQT